MRLTRGVLMISAVLLFAGIAVTSVAMDHFAAPLRAQHYAQVKAPTTQAWWWSSPAPPPPSACCQVSASNTQAACYEYANGKCSKLTSRTIGCNRGVWKSGIQYDPKTGMCGGGCCQHTAKDDRADCSEYLNGKCIKLNKRSIGCNRGVWKPEKQYDAKTGRCGTYVWCIHAASDNWWIAKTTNTPGWANKATDFCVANTASYGNTGKWDSDKIFPYGHYHTRLQCVGGATKAACITSAKAAGLFLPES